MDGDVHFLCLRHVTECQCDGEPHDQAGHDTITAELQRLTLGGRGPERPELIVPSGWPR